MMHINGPISLCWEGRKFRDILDADANLIASSVPVDYATEIVQAVNCHADLIAQRDALAGACEALIKARKRLLEPHGRMMDFADDMARVCGMAGDALAMALEVGE